MSDVDVTVVIPLFDKAATIARAIDSVRAQTHPGWRLVVVDDGSTDGSREIASQFQGERVEVRTFPNGGPGVARNRGLATASTEFVAFLDADDEWSPTFLEQVVAALRADPAADAACSRRTVVGGDGDAVGEVATVRPDVPSRHAPFVLPPRLEGRATKSAIELMHSSAVVARTAAVKAAGGYFDAPHCTYGEDAYLWFHVLLTSRIVIVEEPLMRFHRGASTLGHGRATPYPIPPLVAARARFCAALPPGRREQAERYIEWYAAWCAKRAAAQGELVMAEQLLRARHSMRFDPDVLAMRARARVRLATAQVARRAARSRHAS